jgi:hypothetical protein
MHKLNKVKIMFGMGYRTEDEKATELGKWEEYVLEHVYLNNPDMTEMELLSVAMNIAQNDTKTFHKIIEEHYRDKDDKSK